MKGRVAESHLRDTVHSGRRNDAPKSAADPIPLIVGHNQQDVRCAFGWDDIRRPPRFGTLGIKADLATERGRRIGEVVAINSGGRVRRSWRTSNLLRVST